MTQYTIIITGILVDGKRFTLMRLLDALIHNKPITVTATWTPDESIEQYQYNKLHDKVF